MAFLIAFPSAWLMTLCVASRMVLQPIFVLIQCVPMFALAPIMILWFDWSFAAIVFPTALMIFFPLTMNIYQGLRSTPQHLVDYFKMNGASVWQMFFKLQLPWALPYIFAGIRISAAFAGIGAVAGEWAGAQAGLGLLMIESRRATDLEMTFGALFCLTFVSMGLYVLAVLLEKRVTTRRPIRFRFSKMAKAHVAILFGLTLLGCLQSDSNKKEVRIILDWLPNPNHVPLYVGVEKGIFKKHGIDLVIKKTQDPGDTIPFLTSGQTDLAVSYTIYTMHANAQNASVEPVGILIKEPLNSFLYRKEIGIEKSSDLNHKKIGYCVDGFETRYLDTVLKMNQITNAKKKNVSFDLVSTLGTKKVDAIFGAYWNIEGAHLRSLGVDTDYFPLAELGVPNHYELIIIARENSPQTAPEFVTPFQSALQESIDYSREHPDEAFEVYLQANPDKREKTCDWERKAWQETLPALADTQTIDPQLWEDFHNWLIANGLL